MSWLFGRLLGKAKPLPRNLAPMKTVAPIDFCSLSVTVASMDEPEFGADYLIMIETCYAWLSPYIKAIKDTTGKEIDLCGDASFSGGELAAVKAEFMKAIESLSLLPDQVPVQPLIQENPDGTRIEHRRSLAKTELANFLDVLLEMTERAKVQGRFLYFRGQ